MRFTPLVVLLSAIGPWITVLWTLATALVVAKIAHAAHINRQSVCRAIVEQKEHILLMGFFGTFLGVTAALPHLDDLDRFIEDMAVALVTTLICITIVITAFLFDRLTDPAPAPSGQPRRAGANAARRGSVGVQVAVELLFVLLIIFMALATRGALAAQPDSPSTTFIPPPPVRGITVGSFARTPDEQHDGEGLPADPWITISASGGAFRIGNGPAMHGPLELTTALRAHQGAATRVYIPIGVPYDHDSTALLNAIRDLSNHGLAVRTILVLPTTDQNRPEDRP